MRVEELISSEVVLGELSANIRSSQTGPYLAPASGGGDVVAEPGGEGVEAVLLEGSSGDVVGSIGSGDDEGEDEEDEEEGDEERHGEEVESQEALFVPVGTDEAREGDEEDEEAHDDDGPPEVGDALIRGVGGQPNAGGYDGYRSQARYQVQNCGDVVANPHLTSHFSQHNQLNLTLTQHSSSNAHFILSLLLLG